MHWTYDDFVAILKSDVAKELLADAEVAALVASWKDVHKAALLHANGITAQSAVAEVKPLLQLVAAFANKDDERLDVLIGQGVSVGARLDYMLPLYSARNAGGEDVFVAAVKTMLLGFPFGYVHLSQNNMIHKVGPLQGKAYADEELRGLEGYV